jgi:hypothetical protein
MRSAGTCTLTHTGRTHTRAQSPAQACINAPHTHAQLSLLHTHAHTFTRTHLRASSCSTGPGDLARTEFATIELNTLHTEGSGLGNKHKTSTRRVPLSCTKRAHCGGLAILLQRNGEMVRSMRLPGPCKQGLRTVTVPQKAKNSRSDASSADGGTLSTCVARARTDAHIFKRA